MKTFKIITTLLTSCVILMVAFAIVGCEDEPSSDGLNAGDSVATLSQGSADGLAGSLTIKPDTAQITHIGQQIEFEVQGGHWPYTWSVSDTSRGTETEAQTESTSERFTTVYTAIEVAANTLIVTDANGRTGTKEITGGAPASAAFVMVPSSMNFGTNGVPINTYLDLKVQGGVPPYVWHTDFPSLLGIAPTGETCRVTFIAAVAGGEFSIGVHCVDQSEQVTSAAIKGE